MRLRFVTETADTGARRSFICIVIDIVVLALLLSCADGSSGLARTMQAALDRRHPPLFVFGDSLVDVGNNKFVPFSIVRDDFYPNGVDFVDGPTGRFTNGRTVADILCKSSQARLKPYLIRIFNCNWSMPQSHALIGSAWTWILRSVLSFELHSKLSIPEHTSFPKNALEWFRRRPPWPVQ